MKQPGLGFKVAELRHQKGFTQEELAEACQITTRTVQRIEAGEVEPRPHTLRSLSDVLEFDLGKDQLERERFWLAFLHLSSILPLVIIPLLMWSWMKDRSYQVDQHGRQVLNFQITVSLVLFAGASCLGIGLLAGLILLQRGVGDIALMSEAALLAFLPLVFVGFFTTFQGVVNTIRVLNDQPTNYPLSLQIIK